MSIYDFPIYLMTEKEPRGMKADDIKPGMVVIVDGKAERIEEVLPNGKVATVLLRTAYCPICRKTWSLHDGFKTTRLCCDHGTYRQQLVFCNDRAEAKAKMKAEDEANKVGDA